MDPTEKGKTCAAHLSGGKGARRSPSEKKKGRLPLPERQITPTRSVSRGKGRKGGRYLSRSKKERNRARSLPLLKSLLSNVGSRKRGRKKGQSLFSIIPGREFLHLGLSHHRQDGDSTLVIDGNKMRGGKEGCSSLYHLKSRRGEGKLHAVDLISLNTTRGGEVLWR